MYTSVFFILILIGIYILRIKIGIHKCLRIQYTGCHKVKLKGIILLRCPLKIELLQNSPKHLRFTGFESFTHLTHFIKLFIPPPLPPQMGFTGPFDLIFSIRDTYLIFMGKTMYTLETKESPCRRSRHTKRFHTLQVQGNGEFQRGRSQEVEGRAERINKLIKYRLN